jgi:predicted metal-dependent hydrolase
LRRFRKQSRSRGRLRVPLSTATAHLLELGSRPAAAHRARRGAAGRRAVPPKGWIGGLLRWLKAHALDILDRETREFCVKAGVKASRVGVGDRCRAGRSCSASGTIRYSWRLLSRLNSSAAPPSPMKWRNLVHLNHGKEFHILVARLLGADPRPARLWLRREGASLHRIGNRQLM